MTEVWERVRLQARLIIRPIHREEVPRLRAALEGLLGADWYDARGPVGSQVLDGTLLVQDPEEAERELRLLAERVWSVTHRFCEVTLLLRPGRPEQARCTTFLLDWVFWRMEQRRRALAA